MRHKAVVAGALLLLVAGGLFATSTTEAESQTTLTSVSIDSDNATSSGTDESAKAGDTVTLSFTTDETIQAPTVAFTVGGASAAGFVTVANSAGNNWSAIATRSWHTVALKSDGTLWAWGTNEYGQIGDDTNVYKSIPTQESTGATNWSAIAAGSSHTVALRSDGTLFFQDV